MPYELCCKKHLARLTHRVLNIELEESPTRAVCARPRVPDHPWAQDLQHRGARVSVSYPSNSETAACLLEGPVPVIRIRVSLGPVKHYCHIGHLAASVWQIAPRCRAAGPLIRLRADYGHNCLCLLIGSRMETPPGLFDGEQGFGLSGFMPCVTGWSASFGAQHLTEDCTIVLGPRIGSSPRARSRGPFRILSRLRGFSGCGRVISAGSALPGSYYGPTQSRSNRQHPVFGLCTSYHSQ